MTDFSHTPNFEELDAESKYLAHKAKEVLSHAYAPYSKFLVGAAILLNNEKIVTGSNQENASYPLCMCAERVALYAAISQYPDQTIKKIAVVARRKNSKDLHPATPCGACRQVILEFETRQHTPIQVIMLNAENHWITAPSAESLLPYSFSKGNLEHSLDTH